MEAIKCPYCGEQNHTSCPAAMAECAYCGWKFAEAASEDLVLVILDYSLPGASEMANELNMAWHAQGEPRRVAIVDRRTSLIEDQNSMQRRFYDSVVLH